MAFDITFHPISERELQRFVFDVLDTPSLLEERLAELCPKPEDRDDIRIYYKATLRMIKDERLGPDRDDDDDGEDDDWDDDDWFDDDEEQPTAAHAKRWLAAQVANCLHSAWYSRGMGLQNLGKCEASDFVTPAGVKEIAKRIERKDPSLVRALGGVGAAGWESLCEAVDYATSRDLGMIEASGLMIAAMFPGSEAVNVRTDFMKYVEVDDDIEPRNPTKAMIAVKIGVGLLLLAGGRFLIETGISLPVFVGILLAVLIGGRIAMRELQSRADD